MTGFSGDFSGVMTGILLVMFLGICLWSWSSRRKPAFDEMANLPLEDDEMRDIKDQKMKEESQ